MGYAYDLKSYAFGLLGSSPSLCTYWYDGFRSSIYLKLQHSKSRCKPIKIIILINNKILIDIDGVVKWLYTTDC